MNIHQSFTVPPPKPRISGDRGALLTTLFHLWPYIWPSDRRDLKWRIALASALPFRGQPATLPVSFPLQWATGAFAAPHSPKQESSDEWGVATTGWLTRAYGRSPLPLGLLTQLRDGLFAKVA